MDNYLISLSKTSQDLQQAVEISRVTGLDTPGHEFQPGDWVCLKDWGTVLLQPRCKGPFQVPLTTSLQHTVQDETSW